MKFWIQMVYRHIAKHPGLDIYVTDSDTNPQEWVTCGMKAIEALQKQGRKPILLQDFINVLKDESNG